MAHCVTAHCGGRICADPVHAEVGACPAIGPRHPGVQLASPTVAMSYSFRRRRTATPDDVGPRQSQRLLEVRVVLSLSAGVDRCHPPAAAVRRARRCSWIDENAVGVDRTRLVVVRRLNDLAHAVAACRRAGSARKAAACGARAGTAVGARAASARPRVRTVRTAPAAKSRKKAHRRDEEPGARHRGRLNLSKNTTNRNTAKSIRDHGSLCATASGPDHAS